MPNVKNRYIWLPLFRLTPPPKTEGFPWDDLRKHFPWMSKDGQGTKREEKLPKFHPAEYIGRTNVTDDTQQTDRRRTGNSI